MKTLLRISATQVLCASGFTTLLRRLNRRSLVILCYHRVLPAADRARCPLPDLAVTPEALAQHVEHCRRRYECLTLREAVKRMTLDRPTRRPLLTFTFDDGYWDNHAHARPILNLYGVQATFFVITSLIGTDTMPWYDRLAEACRHLIRASSDSLLRLDELFRDAGTPIQLEPVVDEQKVLVRALDIAKRLPSQTRLDLVQQAEKRAQAAGWRPGTDHRIMNRMELEGLAGDGHEIGSHTRSHPILPQCSPADLVTELRDSRLELSAMLGEDVTSFAYPNGDHDQRVVLAARDAGYRQAVTTRRGLNRQDADPLTLRRIFISQERLSRRDGRCSTDALDLELTGAADAVFLRRHRGQ